MYLAQLKRLEKVNTLHRIGKNWEPHLKFHVSTFIQSKVVAENVAGSHDFSMRPLMTIRGFTDAKLHRGINECKVCHDCLCVVKTNARLTDPT